MGEFDLISRYFADLSLPSNFVELGIGDDAAILNVTVSKRLAVATDTLVVDTHFKNNWPAEAVAHRALTANLSDMAAMGALPKVVLLSLSMPEVNHDWLQRFSTHLKKQLQEHHLSLVGGDTVKGPLSVSMTLIGELHDRALLRDGAIPGDLIYLSGDIGDCAYGLSQLETQKLSAPVFYKLFYPKPQLALGNLLCAYAHSTIDVSDGLLQDLGHMLDKDSLGAVLHLDKLPLGKQLQLAKLPFPYGLALSSGEEYELCFTLPKEKQAAFEAELAKHSLVCHCIGTITDTAGIHVYDQSGCEVDFTLRGHQHF